MIPARADALPEETAPSGDAAATGARRRPARRAVKPDAVLSAAVELARQGILQVAPSEQVGGHVTSYPEAERLTTHRFEAYVPGYGNWHWFVTLARVPRSKEPTICEVGLLPSSEALLAPLWLPWSERVRPEDHEDAAGTPEAIPGPETEPAGTELAENGPAETDPAETGPVETGPVETGPVENRAAETGPDRAGFGSPAPDGEPSADRGGAAAVQAGPEGTESSPVSAGSADVPAGQPSTTDQDN